MTNRCDFPNNAKCYNVVLVPLCTGVGASGFAKTCDVATLLTQVSVQVFFVSQK